MYVHYFIWESIGSLRVVFIQFCPYTPPEIENTVTNIRRYRRPEPFADYSMYVLDIAILSFFSCHLFEEVIQYIVYISI
jgi:hypothetical protein